MVYRDELESARAGEMAAKRELDAIRNETWLRRVGVPIVAFFGFAWAIVVTSLLINVDNERDEWRERAVKFAEKWASCDGAKHYIAPSTCSAERDAAMHANDMADDAMNAWLNCDEVHCSRFKLAWDEAIEAVHAAEDRLSNCKKSGISRSWVQTCSGNDTEPCLVFDSTTQAATYGYISRLGDQLLYIDDSGEAKMWQERWVPLGRDGGSP